MSGCNVEQLSCSRGSTEREKKGLGNYRLSSLSVIPWAATLPRKHVYSVTNVANAAFCCALAWTDVLASGRHESP